MQINTMTVSAKEIHIYEESGHFWFEMCSYSQLWRYKESTSVAIVRFGKGLQDSFIDSIETIQNPKQ